MPYCVKNSANFGTGNVLSHSRSQAITDISNNYLFVNLILRKENASKKYYGKICFFEFSQNDWFKQLCIVKCCVFPLFKGFGLTLYPCCPKYAHVLLHKYPTRSVQSICLCVTCGGFWLLLCVVHFHMEYHYDDLKNFQPLLILSITLYVVDIFNISSGFLKHIAFLTSVFVLCFVLLTIGLWFLTWNRICSFAWLALLYTA